MASRPITDTRAIERATGNLAARVRIGQVVKLYPRRGAAARHAPCVGCLLLGLGGAAAMLAVGDDPGMAAVMLLIAGMAVAGLVTVSGRRLVLLGEEGLALLLKQTVEVCRFGEVRQVSHEVQVSPWTGARWVRIDLWLADGSRLSIPGADLHATPDLLAELQARCPEAQFEGVALRGPS